MEVHLSGDVNPIDSGDGEEVQERCHPQGIETGEFAPAEPVRKGPETDPRRTVAPLPCVIQWE